MWLSLLCICVGLFYCICLCMSVGIKVKSSAGVRVGLRNFLLGLFGLFISDAAKLGVWAEFLIPAAAFNCSWGHFTTFKEADPFRSTPLCSNPFPLCKWALFSKFLLGLELEA